MSSVEPIKYTKFQRARVFDRLKKPRANAGKNGDLWRDYSATPPDVYQKVRGKWKHIGVLGFKTFRSDGSER